MVQFRVDIDGTTFTELDNVKGESTINPFGDRYVVTFRDIEGDKFDSISINSTAEIYAREPTPPGQADNTFDKIFEGYVVQGDTRQEGGRDILDVTIYTFDQLIRNETVSNDQTDKQIDAILKDIIQTDTPVEWVAGNVAVQDNRKIRRSLQGVKVEEALRFLSRRSENEEYGVNPSKEFFFRPREETSTNTDITDNDAVDYNIPERGKEQKTEVTCFYDNGDEDITVTLGSEQLQAQEDFGTQDAVPFPDEINRPSITNRQEALEIARNFARDREQTLAGQVIAVGNKALVDADVGDSINVTLTTRGLDDEFTIVTKEVDYIKNEVALGIVEKRGDQDSLLKAIGQQVKRNELEGADQSKPADIVEQTAVRADITPSFDTLNADSVRLTTTGRNKLRNAWDDGSQPNITIAVLGSGDSVSRADTSVPNQVDTSSTSVGTTSTGSIDFSFSLTGTGDIIGFKDSDGDLIVIALLDSEITDPSDTFNIAITDNSQAKSVLTETGQNLVRDMLNPNVSASLTAQAEFGDGDTDPQETDTSLDNVVDTVTFDDQTVQSASTTSEFDDALQDTERIFIKNDTLKLAQSGFVQEAENASGQYNVVSDIDYSNGDAAELLQGTNQEVRFDITPKYTIPGDEVVVPLRSDIAEVNGDGFHIGFFINIGGERLDSSPPDTLASGLGWDTFGEGQDLGIDLQAGNTYTVRIAYGQDSSENEPLVVDLFAALHELYYDTSNNTSKFDNTVNSNKALDDPVLYPEPETVDLATIKPRQLVKNTTLDISINDTSNNQSLTIGNGKTNTLGNATGLTTFFDAPSQTINGSITLDGFGSRTTATPTERFNGQEVTSLSVKSDLDFLNPTEVGRADIEAFLRASEADGTTYQEVGQSDGSNLLTRSIFPEFSSDSQAVILSEDLGIDIS